MLKHKDYHIAAVDRSLRVLEALAEQPRMGVTDLARKLGQTKSITFRLLYTLEARGFVSRDAERSIYSLGYRVGVLGECAGQQNTLLTAAKPALERLREETSENINLMVREGTQVLVLATLAGRHAMRIFALAGRYGPLRAGGGSLLLLAWAPAVVQEEVLAQQLDPFTADTITDPAALRQRIDQIRMQGYNISINDLDEGAFSIAAPIRNVSGEVIAALSVAGAMARLDDDRQQQFLTLVREAADEISGKLGIGTPARKAACQTEVSVSDFAK